MFNHSGTGKPHRNEGGSECWGRGLGPLETGGQGLRNEKVAQLFPSNKGLLAGDFPSPGVKRMLRAPHSSLGRAGFLGTRLRDGRKIELVMEGTEKRLKPRALL